RIRSYMPEILRFEMNVPAEVSLKYDGPGKPIAGRYGDRVMYTLTDDRVMYVAPIVASRISELGIRPGDVFEVCKQEKRQGQRKLISWEDQRVEPTAETQLEHELRESVTAARAAKAPQLSEASVFVPEAPEETPAQTVIQSAVTAATPHGANGA